MAPRKPATKSAPKTPTKAPSRKAAINPIKVRKSNKPEKKCKQIFLGMTFSCSGNFGDGWEHDKMARWVREHGGVWESEVSEDTTHLICTIKDYKKKPQQVRKAWALGRQCNIIVRDWLEDCLPPLGKKKRAKPEKGYTLDRVLKRVNISHKAQQRYRKSFEEGVRAGHELVDNRLHHVYYDDTGFEYKIVCTRINDSGRVKSEKYTIYFYESNAKPCTYMVGAKLTSPGRPASYWRTECHPKLFNAAFRDFQNFFQHTTGIAWDNRCDALPHDENKFKYHAPLLGRPVGALPDGKRPPGFPKDNAAEGEVKEDVGEEVEMTDAIEKGLVYDTDSEVEDRYDSEASTPKSKRSSKSNRSSTSSQFARSVTSISSESSDNDTLSDSDTDSHFFHHHHHHPLYTQPILPNNTTRLPKPFRSGWGMPAYDRHFVNMPKRFVLPPSMQDPACINHSGDDSHWDINEKKPPMAEERFLSLTMWRDRHRTSFAQKALRLVRRGLCLEPNFDEEMKGLTIDSDASSSS